MPPAPALLLLAALAAALPSLAGACSCAPPPPPLDAAAASELVVFGNVTALSPCDACDRLSQAFDPGATVNATIDVLRGFVGAADGEIVTVETQSQGSLCGVGFAENETWIVYANEGRAVLCSRTRRAEADDPELDALEALRAPDGQDAAEGP